jgi:YfiH family protein
LLCGSEAVLAQRLPSAGAADEWSRNPGLAILRPGYDKGMPLVPLLPQDSFAWAQAPWGPVLVCRPLASVARHLFTTRHLILDREGRGDGWQWIAQAMGVAPGGVVRLAQVHGAGVLVLRRDEARAPTEPPPAADIVVSDRPDLAVAVQVADCVPLLLADARTGAVGAVHAGWRGVAAGAAGVAVEALVRAFGVEARDLVAALGPSIGPCCYEVGEAVGEAFRRAGIDEALAARWFVRGRANRPHLDLWQAVSDQLIRAGVREDRIHRCGLCTASHREVFFSYRADGPGTGRLLGVIRAGAAER